MRESEREREIEREREGEIEREMVVHNSRKTLSFTYLFTVYLVEAIHTRNVSHGSIKRIGYIHL